MLQTSPMRLDPETFAGTSDKENLSFLHGCLLRECNPGVTVAILLLYGVGGDLRVKPAQMEAEPTEVFVPRMKTEENSSTPGPFTSPEQAVFLFFKASLVWINFLSL